MTMTGYVALGSFIGIGGIVVLLWGLQALSEWVLDKKRKSFLKNGV